MLVNNLHISLHKLVSMHFKMFKLLGIKQRFVWWWSIVWSYVLAQITFSSACHIKCWVGSDWIRPGSNFGGLWKDHDLVRFEMGVFGPAKPNAGLGPVGFGPNSIVSSRASTAARLLSDRFVRVNIHASITRFLAL